MHLDFSAKMSVRADYLLGVYHFARWAVSKKYAEFKLSITGKINGQDITPLTLPMARLAEYLTDFATLLGNKEYVHFTNVRRG